MTSLLLAAGAREGDWLLGATFLAFLAVGSIFMWLATGDLTYRRLIREAKRAGGSPSPIGVAGRPGPMPVPPQDVPPTGPGLYAAHHAAGAAGGRAGEGDVGASAPPSPTSCPHCGGDL